MKTLDTKGFSAIEGLLILVIIGIVGGVGYFVYQARDNSITEDKTTVVASNDDKNGVIEAEEVKCTDPTAAVIENIKASITSGNTAALEGYMAAKVNVIFAASEGLGERTASEATGDVTGFIVGATTWDFALANPELSGYQSGDYKQYFPANAVVGKSVEKKLISFTFNCDGKISGIFVTTNSDIL